MLSAVVIATATIKAKYVNEMLSFWEIIQKSLFLTKSLFATPPPNPDSTPKLLLSSDFLPKASTERSNQADLRYFDPHLNKAHGNGELVSMGKNIYYKNVMLFVQRLQSLVIFKRAAFVKANVATSL